MNYHQILKEYLQDYAVEGMIQEGWIYKAAKSYGWIHAARGADYHVDQPLRTHILTGLYAITKVFEYLQKQGYPTLSEYEFKRLLVLYTLHDAYKDPTISVTRLDTGEYSIPLEVLQALYERMNLHSFVTLKANDIRLASVSRQSPRVGDMASSTSGVIGLENYIHLADALASQQSAQDCTTASNYLREIVGKDSVIVRQSQRLNKRLGTQHTQPALPLLNLYYHEIDEYRGLSTLMIHECTEEVLSAYGLYPLLYYPNGNLYIGPDTVTIDSDDVRNKVAEKLFLKLREDLSNDSLADIAREACDVRKGMKVEKYAFLFCGIEALLTAVQEKTTLTKCAGFLRKKVLAKRVANKKYTHEDAFYQRYNIPIDTDTQELQAQRWLAASKFVMAAENFANSLIEEDTFEWLCKTFHTPTEIASSIRAHWNILTSGGVSDHCYIIAYYWLQTTRFTTQQRLWVEVDTALIQQTLINLLTRAFKPYEKTNHLLAFVEKELGFQSDAIHYLKASLTFSFDKKRLLETSPLQEYEREKKQSHKRLCVICSRTIHPSISKKNREIKTTVAFQQAQVFSNKRLATDIVNNDMMVWCPMCYLEFMLRKLSGQSYPEGADYTSSYRLHLYLLPDYAFTNQFWEDTARNLLGEFHPKQTVVSKLALRGSKDDPALPARWLTSGTLDNQWTEQVREMFATQTERLKLRKKKGGMFGDQMKFSLRHPNYMLITYDNVISRSADKNLAPTHIEVWTKALYAAALIHTLTGARVYITDKPYLSLTRPEEMKTIIEMEGLHPLLTSILPVRRTEEPFAMHGVRASESGARVPLASLQSLLDLLAAIWEITVALYPTKPNEPRNLDKQVASILEEIKTNYLAGATLYKTREREKEAYPLFALACQMLLPHHSQLPKITRQALYTQGYELMLDKEGASLMDLAQCVTDTSLQLYIPSAKKEGRAHRFETLFRTGVEAIKTTTIALEESELIERVAGKVLKRLERIIDGKGYAPLHGEERLQAINHFATLLVHHLFIERCGKSVSKLTHEENQLADAIYFLTYMKVNAYWKDKKQQEQSITSTSAGD